MKVVVAHNRYVSAQPSGENTVVDSELAMLAEAGVEVLPFQRTSDEIPNLPTSEKAMLPVSPIYARRAQRELSELLRRERPDVVHLHNPYPLLSPWVIRTAHAHRVPVVHTVHNFRQVCVAGVYYRDGQPCFDCRGKAYPYPAIQHGCYRGSRAQSVVMATALTAHRGTWRSVDRYIALTTAMAAHLRDYGIGDQQITVKPNSLPDPGPHNVAGDGFAYVGRLTEEKGLGLLLDAWRRHPVGALGPLTIIGDGPLREQVAAAAAARDDITYRGQVPHPAVLDAMRAASALITPSTWDEVCPMVVVEALANARPALVTDKGGLPFLVGAAPGAGGGAGDNPQAAGWVSEPTVDALATALGQARQQAAGLAETARRRYLAAFSPEVISSQLLKIYSELAGSRAG
ncbi:MAG: glycosyltransferase family 4 protein [Micromonosporaceae bacterium]